MVRKKITTYKMLTSERRAELATEEDRRRAEQQAPVEDVLALEEMDTEDAPAPDEEEEEVTAPDPEKEHEEDAPASEEEKREAIAPEEDEEEELTPERRYELLAKLEDWRVARFAAGLPLDYPSVSHLLAPVASIVAQVRSMRSRRSSLRPSDTSQTCL